MLIESWDADYLADQETIFGRRKDTGAPLTGRSEFDHADLSAKAPDGSLVIDADAHIRLAAPSSHGGQRILRRGYSYTDGTDPQTGQLDAGPVLHRVPEGPATSSSYRSSAMLGQRDLLNEYIKHVGTGLFAVPPGLRKAGDWYGKALFT